VAGRGNGREHAGAAAADNQHIAFNRDFVGHCSHIRRNNVANY
jgi:hypothetical protein